MRTSERYSPPRPHTRTRRKSPMKRHLGLKCLCKRSRPTEKRKAARCKSSSRVTTADEAGRDKTCLARSPPEFGRRAVHDTSGILATQVRAAQRFACGVLLSEFATQSWACRVGWVLASWPCLSGPVYCLCATHSLHLSRFSPPWGGRRSLRICNSVVCRRVEQRKSKALPAVHCTARPPNSTVRQVHLSSFHLQVWSWDH